MILIEEEMFRIMGTKKKPRTAAISPRIRNSPTSAFAWNTSGA